ncbi:MAG TPA: hypothetical protein VGX68_06220 [Thermoanaerobaculia bacterium]|jgi:hypothetical protein|nr:hypothetical protein [Thermoanaerobaculia bacterium]
MSKSTQMLTLRAIAFLAVLTLQFLSLRPLLAGVQPDPACEQQCHDDYIFCLDYYCDPRGTCSCWTDYQNCVSYCPQICTEPKNVREYSTTTPVNIQMTSTTTCLKSLSGSSLVHNKFYYQYRTDKYRETTHCDNTKTTEFLGSTYSGTLTCWKALYPLQSCSSNNTAPTCPF